MSHLSESQLVAILATFTAKDDAGRHFTERYSEAILAELEDRGYIAIDRPVHHPTGIPFGHEHWTAEVTPEGVELVEAHPEYHPGNLDELVKGFAREDAVAFVAEFGESLDPEETDWDSTAWGERLSQIDACDSEKERAWGVYQAALVAETERLAD